MSNDYVFVEAEALRVREFFARCLRHSKGRLAGQPFILQDWQWEQLIRPLFGWRRRADGTRRYRRAFIELPKKNGKTTLAAAICLYMLLGDGEAAPEVYSVAVDKEQAALVYREMESMCRASPALTAALQAIPSTKRIVYGARNGFYKSLSADAPGKHGINASCLVYDELHAVKSREMFDTLAYAGRARVQPLHLIITTAGSDRDSICYEQHDYAVKVRDGVVQDDSFFPLLYAAGADDDWKSPDTWRKANPSYGVTFDDESFARDAQEAIESPAKENAFKRFGLNIWTESNTKWISRDKWDECGEAFDPETLKGCPAYCGLDLGATSDLSSFVLLFQKDDLWYILPRFYHPQNALVARGRKDMAPYEQWEREGYLLATPGDVTDYDYIRRDIVELAGRYGIREIAFDRWNATQLGVQLQDSDGLKMIAYGQGYYSMSAPCKELERLLLAGKLRHGGNPVLRWMSQNVQLQMDASNNWKPSKAMSRQKIDGVVALLMALGRAMVSAPNAGESVYDARGILAL